MKKIIKLVNNFFYFIFKTVIRFYQICISPLIPARCRYYPTCSEYGRQALAWHGPWRGGLLAINRICRCHPWGGHGVDFVPLPLYQYQFTYIESESENALTCHYWVYKDHNYYASQLNVWLSGLNEVMTELPQKRPVCVASKNPFA